MSVMEYPFSHPVIKNILAGLKREKKLIQILIGPRQAGKTTAAQTIANKWNGVVKYAAADLPLAPGPEWIQANWEIIRRKAKGSRAPVLLILDEIQKVRGWSDMVKRLWDEDRSAGLNLYILLLGSSALLLTKGLSESLAGRFFLNRMPHWTFKEMKEAFGVSMEEWLYFGGYPGTASFFKNESIWRQYILDSLIETVLARDVLQLQTIAKPALIRSLFALSAQHPAQILSYNKMLGQLHDAGNTTTLAHYLKLLETAFLISGIERYSKNEIRKRSSSPKLILWNNALVSALNPYSFEEAQNDREWRGRLIENAVGAHLLTRLSDIRYFITYWREGNAEVDYVVSKGKKTWVIEVKSGAAGKLKGLERFMRKYPEAIPMLIGGDGMELEEFFSTSPEDLFE